MLKIQFNNETYSLIPFLLIGGTIAISAMTFTIFHRSINKLSKSNLRGMERNNNNQNIDTQNSTIEESEGSTTPRAKITELVDKNTQTNQGLFIEGEEFKDVKKITTHLSKDDFSVDAYDKSVQSSPNVSNIEIQASPELSNIEVQATPILVDKSNNTEIICKDIGINSVPTTCDKIINSIPETNEIGVNTTTLLPTPPFTPDNLSVIDTTPLIDFTSPSSPLPLPVLIKQVFEHVD